MVEDRRRQRQGKHRSGAHIAIPCRSGRTSVRSGGGEAGSAAYAGVNAGWGCDGALPPPSLQPRTTYWLVGRSSSGKAEGLGVGPRAACGD